MSSTKLWFALVITTFASLALAAEQIQNRSANGSAQQPRHFDGPCSQDADRLCATELQRGSSISPCLIAHKTVLSPACAVVFTSSGHSQQVSSAEGQSTLHHITGPCEQDADRLCAAELQKGGGISPCLMSHETDLSEACAAVLSHHGNSQQATSAEGKTVPHHINGPCEQDADRLCASELQKGGGISLCLIAHKSELSESCSAVFSHK